jgi:hypothetical protein
VIGWIERDAGLPFGLSGCWALGNLWAFGLSSLVGPFLKENIPHFFKYSALPIERIARSLLYDYVNKNPLPKTYLKPEHKQSKSTSLRPISLFHIYNKSGFAKEKKRKEKKVDLPKYDHSSSPPHYLRFT